MFGGDGDEDDDMMLVVMAIESVTGWEEELGDFLNV